MHRHTVLFNFKDEVGDAGREEVATSLRDLGSLPTVNTLIVEENIVPAGERAPYAWILTGEFADQAARDTYEKDEKHVSAVRGGFLPNVKDFIVCDVNY